MKQQKSPQTLTQSNWANAPFVKIKQGGKASKISIKPKNKPPNTLT